MMIKSQTPRAIALCSLAVLIALFLHLPFIVFPSSFFPAHRARYNADAHLENFTFSKFATLQTSHLETQCRLHRRLATADVYQASIRKGWALGCLMDASIEEAPKMVQNSPKWKNFKMESEFIDPLMAPLEWGWDIKTLDLKDAPMTLSDYRVDKMLEFLGAKRDLKFWTQQLVSHEREWFSEDGRTGPVCIHLPHTFEVQSLWVNKNRRSRSLHRLEVAHAINPSSTTSTAIPLTLPSFYWKCMHLFLKSSNCNIWAFYQQAKSTRLTCRNLLISCF